MILDFNVGFISRCVLMRTVIIIVLLNIFHLNTTTFCMLFSLIFTPNRLL